MITKFDIFLNETSNNYFDLLIVDKNSKVQDLIDYSREGVFDDMIAALMYNREDFIRQAALESKFNFIFNHNELNVYSKWYDVLAKCIQYDKIDLMKYLIETCNVDLSLDYKSILINKIFIHNKSNLLQYLLESGLEFYSSVYFNADKIRNSAYDEAVKFYKQMDKILEVNPTLIFKMKTIFTNGGLYTIPDWFRTKWEYLLEIEQYNK